MKKLVILIIASRGKIYDTYIELLWIPLIEKIKYIEHIDLYLLFSHLDEVKDWDLYNIFLKDNVLFDTIIKDITPIQYYIPGILSKQISAFIYLKKKYDVYWNTNISNILNIDKLDKYIQSHEISYSGYYIFRNEILRHLIGYKYLSNKNTSNCLINNQGRTFISGSGFFLNKEEIDYIVYCHINNKIEYKLINDLSIGLLIDNKSKYNLTVDSFKLEKNNITNFQKTIDKYKNNKSAFFLRLEHLDDINFIHNIINYYNR